ncbi:MAG: STAS domain-containing protein [Lachnospiraceae bacterium]|nr:STAS domain-containing protein [Lachnospiraceae bacterium]
MNKKSKLKPMLFSNMKEYSASQLVKDLVSGLIVAIIALPLSVALALASGVGPEKGIYTAIVAGFIISFLGGSRVQIAGPTAAFATIVAGIVAKNGIDGLVIATIIAGIILIIMGLLRLGSLIRFIPYTITVGFTAGIAVTLLIGQVKDFLGLTYEAGVENIETIDKVKNIVKFMPTFNYQALIIGLVSLAILIFWPKIPKIGAKVPASLIAVLVSIGLVKGVGVDAKTIGDLYEIPTGFPAFSFPAITFAKVRAVIGDSFTIAILAAIESLLSCVVADGMINSHHRSNQELIAQGAGNIGSALFGGIPATGAIARTAANIKNGGRTPIAGMFHAVILVLVVLFLMPYASLIPMPTIAAILFQVAYNMSGWRTFKHLCKTAPKSDILVLFTTFILTVVFDLVVAIGVGMVLACVLLMKRMADETSVKGWKYFDPDNDPDSIELRKVPESIRVYEISGPMFFGATEALMDITVKDFTKVLVIRMRAVPALDASAMHSLEGLYERCEKKGVRMVFSHVNEQPMKTMVKDGFVKLIGEENFCPHIDDALRRAEELAN